MVEEYKVVVSGSPLTEEQLNGEGQDDWILEHVLNPSDSLTFTHIFRKTTS